MSNIRISAFGRCRFRRCSSAATSRVDAFTLHLFTNDEVLAVNQHPLGIRANRVKQQDGVEVWAKKMVDGGPAVGLFIRGRERAVVSVNWHEVGCAGGQMVRDVWWQVEVGVFRDRFSREIPAHGAALVLMRKM